MDVRLGFLSTPDHLFPGETVVQDVQVYIEELWIGSCQVLVFESYYETNIKNCIEFL